MQPHWQFGPTSSMMSELLIDPKVFRPKKYSQMFEMLPLHGRVSVVEPCRPNRISRRKLFQFIVTQFAKSRSNEFDYNAPTHLTVFSVVLGIRRVAKSIADLSAVRIFWRAFAPVAPLAPFAVDGSCVEMKDVISFVAIFLSVFGWQLINRSTLKCVLPQHFLRLAMEIINYHRLEKWAHNPSVCQIPRRSSPPSHKRSSTRWSVHWTARSWSKRCARHARSFFHWRTPSCEI